MHPLRRLLNTFDWTKNKEQTNTPVQTAVRRPHRIDRTYDLVANKALTSGLYHGKYGGLKLASALAFPMISVPVYFMGFPSFKCGDEATREVIDSLIASMTTKIQQLHIESHRDGTLWVWPKFSEGKLRWEFIEDPSVTDPITSLDSGDLLRLYTDEQLCIKTEYNKNVNTRRKRVYTDSRVQVSFTGGQLPDGIKDKTARNLGGIPIPFANNPDSDEIRGHSDYGRVLADLKNYHDVELSAITLLTKFTAKQIQQVKNFDEWLVNNGFENAQDFAENYSLNDTDLVVNVDGEETAFEIPQNLIQGHEMTLKRIYLKLIEGSGCPEICWGVKTEGNANTAEEQMATLIMYVQDKRRQKDGPYLELMRRSLRILEVATNQRLAYDDLTIEWNRLDSVSDKVKSEIFLNFTRGLAAIIDKAGITKEQAFNLWTMNFPTSTEEDFEKWSSGIGQMIIHRTAINSDFTTVQDSAGALGEDPNFKGDE